MSDSLGRTIQCGVCLATFTRHEHLVRHSRGHTTEKPFGCSHCGKSFSRSDALHRHIQSHTEKPVDSIGGSARACKSCSTAKIRCTRGIPCERCKQRQLECIYPVSRKRRYCSSLPPVRSSPRQERNVNLYDNARPLDQPNSSNTMDSTHAGAWVPLPAQVTNTLATFENDMNITFEGNPAPCNLNLEENCNEWPASMLSVNWLYPQDLAMEDSQSDGLSYSSAGTAPQSFAGLEMGLAQVYDESARDDVGLGSTQIHSIAPRTKFPTPEGTLESSLSSSPSFDGMYYVEGTAGRAAFNRRISRSVSSGLSSISQDVFVSQTVYEDLLCKVQAKCNSLGLGPDKATLPTRNEIEQHIQSYFNGFHATYPFLQKKPSQFDSTGGWLLLLAVAAVGLRYSHEDPETSLSYLVDRIVSDHFYDFECNDNKQPWIPGVDAHELCVLDLITVQAGLLNCLLLLHSGRTNSIRRALNQRYRLVEACDRLGLLSAVESTPLDRIDAVSSEDVVARWLNGEARVRTGWMIWVCTSFEAILQKVSIDCSCFSDARLCRFI